VRNWAVRFTLKNRHRRPGLSGPKSAITGSDLFDHLFESDRRAYKIPTSSCPAAASSA
jgi:hypothetical protein